MSTATALAGTRTFRPPKLDRRYLPVLGTMLVFGLMLVIGGLRYDNFLSPAVISNLFINNAHLIVLAAGMTFVILTGGIDLSVGSVLALSSVITATLLNAGWNVALVLPLAIAAGSLLGLGMGVMIQYFEVQPFVATLAGMFLARGLCFVFAPESVPIRDEGFIALTNWGMASGRWRLTAAVVIAALVLLVSWWVLHRSRFGRTVYAVGGGEQSATLMGLRVERTKVMVYVISGTCAGLAGVLFAMFSRSGYALTGVGMELDAIAAVVIGGTLLTGGTGFVLGSVLGVMVLGLIQTIITFEGTLSSWWTKIVIGVLLLVFVILQRILTLRRT
ncbi:galactofuranose ABC transporter, permease protein YjfF [Glutamicibacter endophyticus]|uniref:galactofuranose ABC transporter, permease protein YjfF n=1 Tax=Glutamicibacter endophyticus TaxID=1522174 RepID=UPI003AF0A008